MTNLKIFNAPAGSGKSTEVKARVLRWSENNPQDRMLCVTYTNRAADELKGGISADNVDVSTIHSFLAEFMKPVFSTPEAVKLYLEMYGEAIQSRLDNTENKPHVEKSKEHYREKLGEPLDFEVIAKSITGLRYNETQSSSLFSGGLSHDALLAFSNACILRFPGVMKKLGSKYQLIIIDEYQDTDVEVLEFFVAAAEAFDSPLHLYGDPMQQIYQMTSKRLRSVLSKFQLDARTVTNYRSSSSIVTALNRIYNDENVKQEANDPTETGPPRLHLTTSPQKLRAQIATSETLVLSVRNATILDYIGAKELFDALQKLPEHHYNSRYPALGVLTETRWIEVKNTLVRILYGFLHLEIAYSEGRIGEVIQLLRRYPSFFGIQPIQDHLDKDRLKGELENLFAYLGSDEMSIQDVLSHLESQRYLGVGAVAEFTEDEDYSKLLAVPFIQVRRMREYNLQPNWSTQHGVKGESHERVIFVAEDIGFPVSVKISTLFNLWPTVPFNLKLLEETYVQLERHFTQARNNVEGYYTKPDRYTYADHSDEITLEARKVSEACKALPLFQSLYGDVFEAYFDKLNTTTAKELFKLNAIEGLLTAFRLFYVGCSRAKTELDVVVDRAKIQDLKMFTKKFEELGFAVTNHE